MEVYRSTGRAALALAAALIACALLPQAAGDAPSEPVLLNDICRPETSAVAACVWTGACDRGGCANRCILNEQLAESWTTLIDRSFGPEFYSTCPAIAFWTHELIELLELDTSSRRRLRSDVEISDTVVAVMHARFKAATAKLRLTEHAQQLWGDRAAVGGQGNRRGLKQFSFGDFASAPAPGEADYTYTTEADDTYVAANIPSNPCVTAQEFDIASGALEIIAGIWRDVFEEAKGGGEVSADLANWQFILDSPNYFQFLISMFEDASVAEAYMAANCADRVIEAPLSLHYALLFIKSAELALLDDDLTMLQCVDTFGAIEEFDRNFVDVVRECNPPFDQSPDCFSSVGFSMITSEDCLLAYSKAYNVSDLSQLANVEQLTDAIHAGCMAVTTEEECLAARTDAMQDLADFHAAIPVVHELEIAVRAPLPEVPGVPPVCFGVECPPPAEEAPAPAGGESMQATAPTASPAPTSTPMPRGVPPDSPSTSESSAPVLQPNPPITGDANPPITGDAPAVAGLALATASAAAAALLAW